MFGIANRKQEIKEKEQELAACQAALAQTEHMLGEMSLIWINAEQKISEMERQQRELERQLKQVTSAAGAISSESERQGERNQKLLQQVGKLPASRRNFGRSSGSPGQRQDRRRTKSRLI